MEFIKKLYPSNLQLAGMHDQYVTVPKKATPEIFFGPPPLEIKFIDKESGSYFLFPFKKEKNNEYRLSKFKAYFKLKNAEVGDSIQVNKRTKNNIIIYEIDLIKNKQNLITKNEYLYPEELSSSDENSLPEGAKVRIIVNKYERSKKAREKCIEHWKALCAVCELEFINKYGEIGAGFIHVHHKTPIFTIGKKYKINPISDLIPVCPNCHSMIHKKDPPYTVQEIKDKIINR